MGRLSFRGFIAIGPIFAAICILAAAPPPQQQPKPAAKAAGATLTDYRTVATATTTQVKAAAAEIAGKTGYLGISVIFDKQSRLVVEELQPDSPADKAGVKIGDVVTRIGEHSVSTPISFREWLQTYSAGDTVKLGLLRQDKALELSAMLIATSRPLSNKGGQGGGGGKKGGGAPVTLWKKPAFRLGVIGIEFSDIKHNANVSNSDWADAFFSKGTYLKSNATGQAVHGSLNDYFIEQSGGAFKLEGKVFDWVAVSKKRADYIQGTGTSNKTAVLNDALNKLVARDGKEALKNLDGFVFIYAGDRYKTNAGAVYYPHAAGITFQEQAFPYFLAPEGGSSITPVGGFAKAAFQALGLPDLAARTENIGSRGLGQWCALSNPFTDARPQHVNPWAKEKLGWLKPAVVDPTVKQKLILSAIEDSPKECFKVLVRPNGSEYYLLENRRRKGFDTNLPAEGLLIWRVVNDRPTLCESHGADSPTGPQIYLNAVPFPSEANSAFTPDTVPSSRSPHGGGLPVHISEIRKLEDGRIIFSIGYEYR